MSAPTTTVPDPAVPGDVDEEVAFDETADLEPDSLGLQVLSPETDSPVKEEATADRFTDPGL